VLTTIHQRSLALACVLVAAVAHRALGQLSPARVGLAAGVTAPVSSYGTDKDVGYHIGLLVDVRLPLSPIGLRFDGDFSQLKFSANSTREQIWALTGNVLLKLPTGTPLWPYAIGGVGFYNSRRDLLLGASSNTDPGWNLGGGLRFELGDLTTFVEARYHRASGSSGIRMVPVTLGILF
jgi:opacity protein-like surface antigen